MDLTGFGRFLLIAAMLLAVVGVVLILAGRGIIPRLPGDLSFGRGNFRLYVPLGTSLLLSTLVLNVIFRR